MVSGYAWLVRRPWIALVVALVIEGGIAVACQGDLIASDPLWYASLAHDLATHPGDAIVANHPFEMRVGLTLPLALMYRLLGVSTLVTNLPCILAALGVLLVVYAAAPTPRAKLLGVLFVLACVPLTRHTTFLNVDLPCAALMAATVLFLSRRHQRRGTWWLIAAVLFWFTAFLVKETAVWLAAVWAYAIVRDVRDRGVRAMARMFAAPAAVGCAAALGYLVVCAHVWGDPLARFRGIEELTGQHAWAINGQPASVWIERLGWAPAVLFGKLLGAALVPIVLAPAVVRGQERIWLFATVSLLLLYWFGSASLSAYSPLPILPRMAMPIVACGLVVATLASDRILDAMQRSRWRTPVLIGFLCILVIPAATKIWTTITRARPETAAYDVLREATSDPHHHVMLVCGDPRCEAISQLYFGFDLPSNLTIENAPAFSSAPRPSGERVFAVIDLRRVPKNESGATSPPEYRTDKLVALGLPEIVSDPNVRLYDAGDGIRLWEALRIGR